MMQVVTSNIFYKICKVRFRPHTSTTGSKYQINIKNGTKCNFTFLISDFVEHKCDKGN